MTKFMAKRFSVSAPMTSEYADAWERTFGKHEEAAVASAPAPLLASVPVAQLEQWHRALEGAWGHIVHRDEEAPALRGIVQVAEEIRRSIEGARS